jgi:hypothetical protein
LLLFVGRCDTIITVHVESVGGLGDHRDSRSHLGIRDLLLHGFLMLVLLLMQDAI